MNSIDIKPNYSAIARKYGINRATVKKYFEAGGIPMKKEIIRKSKYDEYDELIKEKCQTQLLKFLHYINICLICMKIRSTLHIVD